MSTIANPSVIDPPGEMMYNENYISGYSDSKNNKFDNTKLADV